ncbi:MAG: HAMP domain-containing histidine kinase, partial [Lentisphaerae bacterium]|nr:HAMP domain-containing histidine kinase [Lentisphaerota bacterium]
RSGAFDYLTKPVSKNAILRAVGNAARVRALDDERRRLEKANAHYRETLEAKVMELKQEVERRRLAEQAKDDFVSMVSHDLRTPLAVARLDAGKLAIEKETIDLLELAQQVCGLLEPLAAEKKVTVEVCADATTIPVLADRQRMFQVLMNLGSNAVKFTAEGSVRIELRQDGREAVITVRDTGAGIVPEDLPLVFDRFPRLKRVYKPGQKGTGLGLSIVKGIVELHGGTISVNSEPGKGSVFVLRLSRDGDAAAGSDARRSEPGTRRES